MSMSAHSTPTSSSISVPFSRQSKKYRAIAMPNLPLIFMFHALLDVRACLEWSSDMLQSKHPLIRTLEFRDQLTDAERSALSQLPGRKSKYSRGQEIVGEGSKPTESCLMTAGFSARSQLLMEGTRQFTALHIPGDFVDLHSFTLKLMDHSVIAVSDCETLFVPHSRLEKIVEGVSASWAPAMAPDYCRRGDSTRVDHMPRATIIKRTLGAPLMRNLHKAGGSRPRA